MAKITYLLGAGASFYACPILEKQAEKMIEVAKHILSDREPYDDYEKQNGLKNSFEIGEFGKLPDDNKFKIAWYIGYFGKKAIEYNTIDTYARKLYLNNEDRELRLLKMSVSVFFDLWENFYHDGIGFQIINDYTRIDNRYKSLFSVLFDKKNDEIKLNNDFKFITWNYDLQLEQTFAMFLGSNFNNDLNSIDKLFKYKTNFKENILNDVFHLNGHRGFFKDVSIRSNSEEYIIFTSQNINLYWEKINWLFESTIRGSADFDSYIRYAWEHNLNDDFFSDIAKIISETEVLIIIGYSFPAFNRKIDQFIFSNLKKVKKIIYQDPNATKETIEALFKKPFDFLSKIEILNNEKSLKQFYLPNEHFLLQESNDLKEDDIEYNYE